MTDNPDDVIEWRDGTTGGLRSCRASELRLTRVPLVEITRPVRVVARIELSALADPACGADWEPLFREAVNLCAGASGPFSALGDVIVTVTAEDLDAMRVA